MSMESSVVDRASRGPSGGSKGTVAVVGAGPGGMAAAMALTRAGFEVSLFERAGELKPLGSGLSLWPPPIRALEYLGVDVERLGAPSGGGLYGNDGAPLAPFDRQPDIEAEFGGVFFGLLRPELYRRMLAAIPPGILTTGKECVEVQDAGGRVKLRFADASTFEADLVVGADGLNSAVRRCLWGESPLRPHNIMVTQGFCRLEGPDRSSGPWCFGGDIQASWGPILIEGEEGWQWWTLEPWQHGRPMEADPKAHAAELAAGFQPTLKELIQATDPADVIQREIIDRVPLKQWSRGRAILIGDAAHPTSPYAAYGAGMAIEDGFYLASFLAGTNLSDGVQLRTAFAAFEAQRVKTTAKTVEFAHRLGRIWQHSGPLKRRLRDALFGRSKLPGRMVARSYIGALRSELAQVEQAEQRLTDRRHG